MTSPKSSSYSLDPDVTYLNHGSFGACPRLVQEEQTRLRERMEAQPVRFFHRDYAPRLDVVRHQFSEFIGANPEHLVFVSNATEGVAAVLRSLDWDVGDELLLTSLGYDAVANAANYVAGRAGVRVVVAPVSLPLVDTDEILREIEKHLSSRTRLVVLDHIASQSGIRLPVERICKLLQERGVVVLVDGAHAPGQIDLDVESVGATYYVGNAHKWLGAPRGTGFLWAREESQRGLRPPTISHGATWKRPGRSRFHDEFDWTGTRDYSAVLALPRALTCMDEIHARGWDGAREDARALCRLARELLEVETGAVAVAPADAFEAMGTLLLPSGPSRKLVDSADARALYEALVERNIEVPVFAIGDLGCFIRVSAWVYNDAEQFHHLSEALIDEGCGPKATPPARAR